MTNKLKTIFAVTFTLLLFSISSLACICVRQKIKAKGFSGQVFAVSEENPSIKDPMPNAKLRLLKETDEESVVIAEIVADEDGNFSLENIKAGSYFLEAEALGFRPIGIKIKILGSSSGKKNALEIGLDVEMKCCGGYVKVQKAKKTS